MRFGVNAGRRAPSTASISTSRSSVRRSATGAWRPTRAGTCSCSSPLAAGSRRAGSRRIPSGDVWVANCFASGGRDANVVRVDATTLNFEATYPVPEGDVPAGEGYYRGHAYGGGSLWVGQLDESAKHGTVIQVHPRSGKQRAIRLPNPATGALAWAETSGEVWVANFGEGTLTRVRASTRAVETVDVLSGNPAHILRRRGGVGRRLGGRGGRASAYGWAEQAAHVALPARYFVAGVWNIAAGEGYIWATTPRVRSLWQIDPKPTRLSGFRCRTPDRRHGARRRRVGDGTQDMRPWLSRVTELVGSGAPTLSTAAPRTCSTTLTRRRSGWPGAAQIT